MFSGVVNRFRPEVQTLKLRSARVEEKDCQAIFAGMTRCSKYSGHDQPTGASPDLPTFADIQADYDALVAFVTETSTRKSTLDETGKQSEKPLKAEVM